MIGPVIQAITPYRLRGMGAALGSLYIFFIGATGGALLSAFLTDAVGHKATVLILMIPSSLVGGLTARPQLVVHQERHVPRRGRAPGGDGGVPAPEGPTRGDPRPPGHRHRLQLRPGAGPLRRGLRSAQGRGPRPARDQRRRQVHDPAGDRRPRHARPRRRAPRRPDRHLRLAREAGPHGHPPAARRQGRLPADDRPREPRDGGVRVPRRQGGPGAPHRQGARPLREPGRTAGPERAARCPAASSRCWLSPVSCCTSPRCCSSTSCPSACRRSWSRSSSRSSSG